MPAPAAANAASPAFATPAAAPAATPASPVVPTAPGETARRLVITSGAKEGLELPLEGEQLTIGRSAGRAGGPGWAKAGPRPSDSTTGVGGGRGGPRAASAARPAGGPRGARGRARGAPPRVQVLGVADQVGLLQSGTGAQREQLIDLIR